MGTSAEHDASGSVRDSPDDAARFHAFFERHYAELSRLAHLLTGEADAADDLAADALVAVWRHWPRVQAADNPAAYARGVVANLARSRIRSAVRERRRVALFWSHSADRVDEPDVPAVLDLRQALQRLPFRKRACVVLRHAFDLSEKDTAAALGISVGTVKSQTSRGVAELERLLGPRPDAPAPTAVPPAAVPADPSTGTGIRTAGDAERPRHPAAADACDGPPPAPALPATATATAAAAAAEEPVPAASGALTDGGAVAGGDVLAAGGSAPAPGPAGESAAAARILGATNPATRARTRTGRGV